MKTLGINIDGVIRMYLEQFDKQYRKAFIHNESHVEMNDDFTVKEQTEQELESLHDAIIKKVSDSITLPVDSFDLLNHYKFQEKTTKYPAMNKEEVDTEVHLSAQQVLEEFMFEQYPFQIFGNAEEFPGAMNVANKIQHFGLTNKLFKTVLLSTLKGQAISATYFFLSKTGSRIKNITFLGEDYEKWDHCDVIVDVMPEVFQNKPKNKTSIKINRLYNQWDSADYSFDSLKDINDEILLKKIFN